MRISKLAVPLAAVCAAILSPASARGENAQLTALLAKGDGEVSKGDLRAALADFEQADQLSPDNVEVLLRLSQQRGDLIDSTKNQTEAQSLAQVSLDEAKRSVALAPGNAKAHLALSIAYGRMTDFVSNKTKMEYSRFIKSEAEKALQLDPHEDFAYHVLGRWHYGVANLNPVLKMLARVVYGGMPDASNESAAKYLKKATELAPQRILHHNELGKVYAAMGKRDLARKQWETVLKLKPEDSQDKDAQQEARGELGKK